MARALLLLARYGKPNQSLTLPSVSQNVLAEMVGTTRTRVNFFMNKFRKLGFIEYNGELNINNSLLSVVLRDRPTMRPSTARTRPVIGMRKVQVPSGIGISAFVQILMKLNLISRVAGPHSVPRLSLSLNNMIPDRVTDEFCNRMTIQFPHNVRPVGVDRFDAEIQHRRHFLGALAFRQKLHDFSFPCR